MTLVAWLAWQFTPLPAVFALASLSDPAKLATLGKRGANARLNKIVYWLDQARGKGLSAETAVGWTQTLNRTKEPRAGLVKTELLRNLKLAEELGLLTPDNRDRLRRGHAAVVTRGPYAGETVEIDHIVPISLAPEAGNELANLEMLPKTLNRQKSNRVGERQLAHAKKLFEAGLLTKASLARVEAKP
ncbi:MAG: hypothetical protein HZA90_29095 [Verrucomicrobia bacterium]|nr:hypothetical protein [Verrucomicrobiota bacterium]